MGEIAFPTKDLVNVFSIGFGVKTNFSGLLNFSLSFELFSTFSDSSGFSFNGKIYFKKSFFVTVFILGFSCNF